MAAKPKKRRKVIDLERARVKKAAKERAQVIREIIEVMRDMNT